MVGCGEMSPARQNASEQVAVLQPTREQRLAGWALTFGAILLMGGVVWACHYSWTSSVVLCEKPERVREMGLYLLMGSGAGSILLIMIIFAFRLGGYLRGKPPGASGPVVLARAFMKSASSVAGFVAIPLGLGGLSALVHGPWLAGVMMWLAGGLLVFFLPRLAKSVLQTWAPNTVVFVKGGAA